MGPKENRFARQEPERRWRSARLTLCAEARRLAMPQGARTSIMSKEQENKAIVGRWFTEFWGKSCNLGVVDELAAPDMLMQYSLHEPRRGRDDIKAFMT